MSLPAPPNTATGASPADADELVVIGAEPELLDGYQRVAGRPAKADAELEIDLDRLIGIAVIHDVVAVAAVDEVGAASAVEDVVAAAAAQDVVAVAAGKRVVAIVADQRVGRIGSGDDVVAGGADRVFEIAVDEQRLAGKAARLRGR